MLGLILDLLPDEPGEVIGFGIFAGATFYYVDSLQQEISKQKANYNILVSTSRQELSTLKEELEKNTLSESALNYVRENF